MTISIKNTPFSHPTVSTIKTVDAELAKRLVHNQNYLTLLDEQSPDVAFLEACREQNFLMLDYILMNHEISADIVSECLLDSLTHRRIGVWDYLEDNCIIRKMTQEPEKNLAEALKQAAFLNDKNAFKTGLEIEGRKSQPDYQSLFSPDNYSCIYFCMKHYCSYAIPASEEIITWLIEKDYILGTDPAIAELRQIFIEHLSSDAYTKPTLEELFIGQEKRHLERGLDLEINRVPHSTNTSIECDKPLVRIRKI